MTEQEQNIEQDLSQEQQTPGQVLSAARLAQGIELSELSELIKVPLNVLEAIEKDRTPKNLPETFLRGYIRSYARKVGVEESLVLTQVETTAAFEKPPEAKQEMQSFSRRNKRKALERRLTIATWVIALVLILAAAIWWWQDSKSSDIAPVAGQAQGTSVGLATTQGIEQSTEELQAENQPTEIITTTVSELTPAELAAVAEEVEPEVNNAEAPSTSSSFETLSVVEQVVVEENRTAQNTETSLESGSIELSERNAVAELVEDSPMQLTAEQKALVADNGEVDEEGFIKVEMKFENDCWVEVYDVNEERIAVGNKPAGYLMTLNAQGPFNVLLGNPAGVSIWINGEPYDMSDLPRNRVARFELDLPMTATSQVVQ